MDIIAGGELVLGGSAEVVYPNRRSREFSKSAVTVYRDKEDDTYWFCYEDGCRFRIGATGAVAASRPPSMSIDDLLVYFLGPILGFVLRLQGVVSLHASAIVLDGSAVAFVGAGGSGKSTLAARFGLNRYSVITDDVLPLDATGACFAVRPVVPHLKLWPDSVARLYGRPDALPKLVPSSLDWDKRRLDLAETGMLHVGGSPPLGAIFLLQPRSATTPVPTVSQLTPAKALVALIANSYVNYALSKEMREHEFRVLSRLIHEVPVRCLTLPETISDLRLIADALRSQNFDAEGP